MIQHWKDQLCFGYGFYWHMPSLKTQRKSTTSSLKNRYNFNCMPYVRNLEPVSCFCWKSFHKTLCMLLVLLKVETLPVSESNYQTIHLLHVYKIFQVRKAAELLNGSQCNACLTALWIICYRMSCSGRQYWISTEMGTLISSE